MACQSVVLTKLYGDFCSPALEQGQIEMVLIAKPGANYPNWNDPAGVDLSGDISNTADEATDPVRFLHVIGSMPAPTRAESTITLQRKAYGKPKYSIPIKCHDVGIKEVTIGGTPTDVSNLDFVRDLQNNPGASYAVWLLTKNLIIGGPSGIPATIKLDLAIPESNEEYQTIEGNIEFEGTLPLIGPRPTAIG